MPRHRRQVSQVLPPDFISGEELPPWAGATENEAAGYKTSADASGKSESKRTEQEGSARAQPAQERKPPTTR